MEIIFTKSNWEMPEAPLSDFLDRAKSDGFDAVEIFLPALAENPTKIREAITQRGLRLVAQITTDGATPDAHIESLIRRFEFAAQTQPLLINCHTGRDIFSFEDNQRIFRKAAHLSEQTGVSIAHETHRSRPTFCGPETRRHLQACPDIFITADFSHWFCVHETDLSDQPENLELAIQRARHIHARVGFEEGPQIPDPEAPEWHDTVAKHIELWQRIIESRRVAGADFITITPEFGPPPYMPTIPYTAQPLADAWEINARFRERLATSLR